MGGQCTFTRKTQKLYPSILYCVTAAWKRKDCRCVLFKLRKISDTAAVTGGGGTTSLFVIRTLVRAKKGMGNKDKRGGYPPKDKSIVDI